MSKTQEVEEDHRWHAMDGKDVISELEVDENGLANDEAARRLEKHGPNELPSRHRQSALTRLLKQFHNLLIYILLVASI